MVYCGIAGTPIAGNQTCEAGIDHSLTPSEADNIVFDVGLTILVAFGTFGTLIGIGIAYNLMRGKKWNGKGR